MDNILSACLVWLYRISGQGPPLTFGAHIGERVGTWLTMEQKLEIRPYPSTKLGSSVSEQPVQLHLEPLSGIHLYPKMLFLVHMQ